MLVSIHLTILMIETGLLVNRRFVLGNAGLYLAFQLLQLLFTILYVAEIIGKIILTPKSSSSASLPGPPMVAAAAPTADTGGSFLISRTVELFVRYWRYSSFRDRSEFVLMILTLTGTVIMLALGSKYVGVNDSLSAGMNRSLLLAFRYGLVLRCTRLLSVLLDVPPLMVLFETITTLVPKVIPVCMVLTAVYG